MKNKILLIVFVIFTITLILLLHYEYTATHTDTANFDVVLKSTNSPVALTIVLFGLIFMIVAIIITEIIAIIKRNKHKHYKFKRKDLPDYTYTKK